MNDPKVSQWMKLDYDFDDLDYEAWLDSLPPEEYDEHGEYIGEE